MKKNKISLNILNKMKEQVGDIQEENAVIIAYESKINYQEYELTNKDMKTMLFLEEKVIKSSDQLKKNLIDLADGLYKAQNIFANNKTGTFQKWFEELGLKKTFVYTLLKRQELYVEFKDEKIFQIPERVLPELNKIKKDILTKDILKIINSEKPLEEVKNISFGSRTIKSLPNNNIIEEAIIVESNEEEIKNIEDEISKYYKLIEKLQKKLIFLKK